jgi:hypothetical protein
MLKVESMNIVKSVFIGIFSHHQPYSPNARGTSPE